MFNGFLIIFIMIFGLFLCQIYMICEHTFIMYISLALFLVDIFQMFVRKLVNIIFIYFF